ncbi:hypothetical protein GF337_12325 [candidate division KSB1 bacterium]|nr:hypothetical protein [candidate division KSB1 bacterium]
MGIGDRFAQQGKAQLDAIKKASELGLEITPVWNKSFREHQIVKSEPTSTRKEADDAVKALGWNGQYFVDADHVGLKNVDFFIDSSDFFTLDVADFIGEKADGAKIDKFIESYKKYIGEMSIPGISDTFKITEQRLEQIANKFLFAIDEAAKIYKHISRKKDSGSFVVEVSMDETDEPQTPVEMLFILAMISDAGIPAQTIAPKFTGRFNKGVDYVGAIDQFKKEFEQDIAVIQFAIREFSMQDNLKLSVHSGSDKFSIYKPMGEIIRKMDAGLHLKTAGTTWLEELIGLAEGNQDGQALVKEVYRNAYNRYDELCGPYAAVIDIDPRKLPSPDEVDSWSGESYAAALRHDQDNPGFNPHFRQLLHVGYKVAAEMGDRYLNAVRANSEIVSKNVTENIFERHIKRLFL